MNTAAAGLVRDQGVIDREHLRLLSIFHFVAAGMAFLGLLFVLGHYAIFSVFLSDPQAWTKGAQGPTFVVLSRDSVAKSYADSSLSQAGVQ